MLSYLWYTFRDHNDRTALHIAAMKGSKRCVQCILQNHPQCINLFDKDQVRYVALRSNKNLTSWKFQPIKGAEKVFAAGA